MSENSVSDAGWRCCGCGKPSPDRRRNCDCATSALYAPGVKGSVWKVDPEDEDLERYAALGRACESNGLGWYNEDGEMRFQPPSDVIAEQACAPLYARIAELEAENFALAAGACEHRVGDERGHPYCQLNGKYL